MLSSLVANADLNSVQAVVEDPSIRLRCEELQGEKRKKIENKNELISLAKKNIRLRKYAPYEKRTVKEKLKKNYLKILDKIKERNEEIELMTEVLVRKGCPSNNFNEITEEYVKKFLARTERSLQTLRGRNLKKADYSEEAVLGGGDTLSNKEEIQEMEALLDTKKDEKKKAINHFGMSVFTYTQSYDEQVEELDNIFNTRSVPMGFGAYYQRETTLFSRPVQWTTNIEFGTESELEVVDQNGVGQVFDPHVNLIASLSLRTSLWKNKVGVFGFTLFDQLTTLYNADLTETNPALAVDVKNYGLVWVGGGLDFTFRFLKRPWTVSGQLSSTVMSVADVEDPNNPVLTLTGLRLGFDLGVKVIGNFWGEFKIQNDSYTGASNLSSSRITMGLRYHFF